MTLKKTIYYLLPHTNKTPSSSCNHLSSSIKKTLTMHIEITLQNPIKKTSESLLFHSQPSPHQKFTQKIPKKKKKKRSSSPLHLQPLRINLKRESHQPATSAGHQRQAAKRRNHSKPSETLIPFPSNSSGIPTLSTLILTSPSLNPYYDCHLYTSELDSPATHHRTSTCYLLSSPLKTTNS